MAIMGGLMKSILFPLLLATVAAKVHLVDHGYEGVVVAVNPDIKENPDLLTRLERILTTSSATLFRATKNQLYFKEFIIVLPEDWSSQAFYENALDVELEKADFVIDRSNQAHGDAPYVKQYAECGNPGLYIHLTPNYILDDQVVQKWGQPEKTIVHEWAHLRWGLFDEYPADAQDEHFYRFQKKWHPTRCSTEVDGVLMNEYTSEPCQFDFVTGKPERNCQFFPRMSANKAASSLMFMQYLDSIVEFCDDPAKAPKHLKHNRLAPNRQNRLCNYQSAWEVMKKHKDFIKLANKRPLPDTTRTRPKFRYVQAHPRKRVLVLDTSGSMTGTSLNVMKQAASNYILSCIETGSQLGIVQFNTKASTLSQLVEVTSETDRESLIDALPSKANGKTSIGSGLELGLEVLTKGGHPLGGSIILITDGKENQGPYLKEMEPSLVKNGVVVHAFSYGQKAEHGIAELSDTTGGKTIFYSGSQNSTALIDGLAATVATENSMIPNKNVSISILTEANVVTNGSPLIGKFYIDSTIGKETSLTFSYTEHIEVDIESPDGPYQAKKIKDYSTPEMACKVLKVILEDELTPGLWTYRVNTNSSLSAITVNVQSKPRQEGKDVLQIHSWISDKEDITFNAKRTLGVYAEVMRGKAPVLGASVIGTVETPDTDTFDIQLFDNGIGPDIIKGDGIYSANIIAKDFTGNGRYNIKIKVLGSKAQTRVIVDGHGSASGALERHRAGTPANTESEPIEDFQRVTTAGEFRLKGFTPPPTDAAADQLAPARITDLHARDFDFEELKATLVWTAVGGDMERGQASHYVIYVSHELESILVDPSSSSNRLASEDVRRGNLTSPQPSGQAEEFVVLVPDLDTSTNDNDTIYLSIVAVDENGNEGLPSNVVTLSRARELSVDGVSIPRSDLAQIYLIIGISLTLACLVLIIVGIVHLVVRSRRTKSKEITRAHDWSSALSSSSLSIDLGHMNYMYDGQYRKRLPEEPETWSSGSK